MVIKAKEIFSFPQTGKLLESCSQIKDIGSPCKGTDFRKCKLLIFNELNYLSTIKWTTYYYY
jgi:hypothetical protein